MLPGVSVLQVFGNIDLNEDTAINHHNNFRTFLQALMLLFRYMSHYFTLHLHSLWKPMMKIRICHFEMAYCLFKKCYLRIVMISWWCISAVLSLQHLPQPRNNVLVLKIPIISIGILVYMKWHVEMCSTQQSHCPTSVFILHQECDWWGLAWDHVVMSESSSLWWTFRDPWKRVRQRLCLLLLCLLHLPLLLPGQCLIGCFISLIFVLLPPAGTIFKW